MKKIITLLLCVLLSSEALYTVSVKAEENLSGTLKTVYATFMGERMEVSREIMEVDGDYHEPIRIEIQMSGDTTGYEYYIVQYTPEKTKYLKNSKSTTMEIYPDEMDVGVPTYLKVLDQNHKDIYTRILNFRVNKGAMSSKVPVDYGAEFGKGFFIDMSSFLPGMQFNLLPCLIPVTVKVYGDGRFVLGMGLNSTDTEFWSKAASGTFAPAPDADRMRRAYETKQHDWSKTNLGMMFVFSGYIQGNVNTDEPLHGQMSMYCGGGVDATGQYGILTWEITATAGINGSFDFSIVLDSVEDAYQFQPDKFQIGWKAAIEAFGGLGLARIFAVGIYGAASFGVEAEFYPQADVNHLILAGEFGMKVKLLGKNILVFKLVSGSHDFVQHDDKKAAFLTAGELKQLILDQEYAKVRLKSEESDEETIWHTNTSVTETENHNTGFTAGLENGADYAYLLAENIYPDNHIQLINTGNRTFPEMNAVFLGNDTERTKGNRSRLMGFYLDPQKDFVSDPYWIDFMDEDDGTADLDPYLYHDDISNNTFLVYKNAMEQLKEDASLEEIAKATDLYFGEYHVGTKWQSHTRVTDLYESDADHFATGAKVSADVNGDPVISYYVNPADDPAGLREEVHPVYIAEYTDELKNSFTSTLVAEIDGSITEVDNCSFNRMQTVAVSYTKDGVDHVELYRNGQKFWEKENAACGQFTAYGYNYHLLTWVQDGSLYGLDESGREWRITPEDMTIPSTNYRLYGKFGSESVIIVGTSAKDSRENAFAMLSNDGGATWRRVDLTNVSEYGIVNNIGIAFTYDDEPFVLYSVQKYQINYDPSETDALAMIGKDTGDHELLNDSQKLLLGGEDDRFTDIQADLYIKARSANTRVRITGVEFLDPDHAQPQKGTPAKITLENNGLYPIDAVVILQSDVPINRKEIRILPGESGEIEMVLLVNSDGSHDEPLEIPLSVTATNAEAIEGKYTAELTNGYLEVSMDHELTDGTERFTYSVFNNGFSTKGFYVIAKDADTGEEILKEYHYIRGGAAVSGEVAAKNKLFSIDGHENVTFMISRLNENEEEITSDRKMTIRSLDPIYAQSIDGLIIPTGDVQKNEDPASDESKPSDKDVTPVRPDPEKKDPEESEIIEPDKEDPKKDEDKPKKEEEKPDKENDRGEDKEPEKDDKKEEVPKKNYSWIAILAGTLLVLFLFLIFLFKRRKDEEE